MLTITAIETQADFSFANADMHAARALSQLVSLLQGLPVCVCVCVFCCCCCCLIIPTHVAVPPAYYAHLAAFRARYYDEQAEGTDGASVVSGGPAAFRRLPQLKDKVKEVMFFCW